MKQERSLEAQDFGYMWQKLVQRAWVLMRPNVVREQNWARVVFVLGQAAA
jgi:hypothetical protein